MEKKTQKCLEAVSKNIHIIVSDDIGSPETDYNMSSINLSGDLKSPGDPPDKKITDADAEKQPLSGVSIYMTIQS